MYRNMQIHSVIYLLTVKRIHLGKTDQTILQSLLMNNSEWVSGSQESFLSKHPIWNTIYKTQANFLEVNEKDFFLVINPVLQFQLSESDRKSRTGLSEYQGTYFSRTYWRPCRIFELYHG